MQIFRKGLVSCLMVGSLLVMTEETHAANNNWGHEILVYSLEQYGSFYDSNIDGFSTWKSNVPVSNARDPYYDFWSQMNCSGWSCMHVNSIRRHNSEVTVDSMVATTDGWPDADLVFFYGHNTQVQPQWPNASFKAWKPFFKWNGSFWLLVWGQFTLPNWQTWGTPSEPYRYHRNFITNASLTEPYAVFYAYNPLTSVLIGEDFTGGTWNTENTYNQSSADGHTGKLGKVDTEWVIAHGCNAVTVADYNSTDDIVSTPLGVNAWKKSWSRLHTVLGHYHGTYTTWEPNLNNFAADLKSGDVLKEAYFDAHAGIGSTSDPAMGQPAAISVSPDSCCQLINLGSWWFYWCPISGCSGDYMHNETWTSPMSDPADLDDYYFTTSWTVAE